MIRRAAIVLRDLAISKRVSSLGRSRDLSHSKAKNAFTLVQVSCHT